MSLYSVHNALAVAALAAAVVLLLSHATRALALLALAAAGVEVLMAFGRLELHLASPALLQLVLGALLLVPAVLIWLRAAGKPVVSAATVLGFVGALQVLLALLR